jgi:hypothetical protein|nr:MAG TPA: hypothetical protein [Caudoviricetes sp.]
MKTYTELLREVKDFADENLGKKFVIKREGAFEKETATVAGYATQDGLGYPSVIMELPDTLPMGNRGWSPEDEPCLYDRILLETDPTKSYWYVYIEDLEDAK